MTCCVDSYLVFRFLVEVVSSSSVSIGYNQRKERRSRKVRLERSAAEQQGGQWVGKRSRERQARGRRRPSWRTSKGPWLAPPQAGPQQL